MCGRRLLTAYTLEVSATHPSGLPGPVHAASRSNVGSQAGSNTHELARGHMWRDGLRRPAAPRRTSITRHDVEVTRRQRVVRHRRKGEMVVEKLDLPRPWGPRDAASETKGEAGTYPSTNSPPKSVSSPPD